VVKSEARPRWLVPALLGGGLTWVLHLMGSYALVTLGCAAGWSGTGLALGAFTVVCGAVAVAIGLAIDRARRSITTSPTAPSRYPEEPARFALEVGTGLAALFAVLIALGGFIPLLVPLCAVSS
jgi:hypothetical protein